MTISTSTPTCKTIRVLHIFSGDLWAGAEVMIYNLLNELKDYCDFKIVALSLNEGILTDKLKEAGVETYIIPESNNSFLKIFFKALKLFKKNKIDIIHSHRYKENLLAFLLAKALGVKRLITTMHGLSETPFQKNATLASFSTSTLTSTSFYEQNTNKHDIKTRLNYFILNNFFSRVIAVSQEMKKTLVQGYHFIDEKLEVIYNGIPISSSPLSDKKLNLDLSLNPTSNGIFHIGTVGRMVPVKDFDLFLEVASIIRMKTNEVGFSILGEGPKKEHLKKKAKVLGLEGFLEFLPTTPDPMPYFRSLDLYLNTSIHEGIPLSVLEAMSCGIPVVAPNVGGIPEIISDGEQGFLIKSRNPEEFAKFCLIIMQDKDLRNKLAENSRNRVSSLFNSLKMAESYRRLYQEICNNS